MKKLTKIIKLLLGLGIYFGSIYLEEERIKTEKIMKNRNTYYYQFMQDWFKKVQENKNMKEYLIKNKIEKIIIYGTGTLCDAFYQEIIKLNIPKIICMIDKKPLSDTFKLDISIPIITLNDINKYICEADAIIITPIYEYNEIIADIRKTVTENINCKIISLETIVNNYK